MFGKSCFFLQKAQKAGLPLIRPNPCNSFPSCYFSTQELPWPTNQMELCTSVRLSTHSCRWPFMKQMLGSYLTDINIINWIQASQLIEDIAAYNMPMLPYV